MQNFLYGEPLITAKYEDELSDKLNQEVTLEEVNQELQKLITHQNQAFVVYAPENPSIVIPFIIPYVVAHLIACSAYPPATRS